MEAKKRSFVSTKLRWGFLFILILLLGVSAWGFVFYGSKWLFREDFGTLTPTRSYALEVANKLLYDIGQQLQLPSELFRWRETGTMDREPTFSPAALFWFTYNSKEDEFDFHWIDSSLPLSSDYLGEWEQRLKSRIDSTLAEKEAGQILKRIEESEGEFRLNGRVYKDEPRVVAMITDMDKFRQSIIPKLLEESRENFPSLDIFTTGPGEGMAGKSPLYIVFRDREDHIFAQLGVPGEQPDRREPVPFEFKKEFPTRDWLGLDMEVGIPRCLEMIWLAYLKIGFYGLVIVWIATMVLWARAEISRKKSRQS